MPSNILLHFLSSPYPQHHTHGTWLRRLPKKLEASIFSNDSPVNFGWGIHIVEGPNMRKIACVMLLGLLVSFMATGLWWVRSNDIQGATGLGSLMLAALGLMAALFITSRRHA
jgi:hypothetical protein